MTKSKKRPSNSPKNPPKPSRTRASATRKRESADSQGRAAQRWGLFAVCVVLFAVPIATPKLPGDAWFTYDPFNLPRLAVTVLVVSAGLLVWLVDLTRNGGVLRWHPSLWVVVGLVVWQSVTALTGMDWRSSFFGSARQDGAITLIAYAAFALLVLQVADTPDRLRTCLRWATYAGVLLGLYAIAQEAGLDPVRWPIYDPGAAQTFATFGNPNLFAGYVVFPFLAAVGLALDESTPPRSRWIAYASVTVMAIGLVLSRSRGAWLGALVGVVIMVIALVVSRRSLTRLELASSAFSAIAVAVTLVSTSAGQSAVRRLLGTEAAGVCRAGCRSGGCSFGRSPSGPCWATGPTMRAGRLREPRTRRA